MTECEKIQIICENVKELLSFHIFMLILTQNVKYNNLT